jgi:RNA polymerase sigma-70 factor (ECF subfamily)
MAAASSSLSPDGGNRHFATTHWSLVLAAGDGSGGEAQEALEQLCRIYWYPLYAYVRRRTRGVHEAQDLTQAFFFQLLEKHAIGRADRSRGRFRAFLLTALKNFLANEWEKAGAEKRGGGRSALPFDLESGEARFQIEPSHDLTAERLYERRWVLTLLDRVLDRVQEELIAAGKADHFTHFKIALTGEATDDAYGRAAEALGITPAAAKQAAYRLRKRYRELFREEVARTVADDSEVDDEINRLLTALRE